MESLEKNCRVFCLVLCSISKSEAYVRQQSLGLGEKSFHPSHFYLSFAFPNVLSAEKKQKPSFILLINSFDEEFFLKPQIYSLKITP